MKKNNIVIYMVLIYFISMYIAFIVIEKNKDDRVEFILDKHLANLQVHYEIFLKNNSNLADLIYEETIFDTRVIALLKEASQNQNDVKKLNVLREKLRILLEPRYSLYKNQNVLQYHFIFEDNHSFLRMHKPDKYGDDLTNIRTDFVEVNKTKKRVRGFSQGRTAHGFRNVYPIFDEDGKYISAMEVSFATSLLQNYLNTVGDMHSHFLLKKETFNKKAWAEDSLIINYQQSFEHDRYVVTVPNKYFNKDEITHTKRNIVKIRDEINKKIMEDKKFSIYLLDNDTSKAISFYPIQQNITNEKVAWIVTYEKDDSILYLINRSDNIFIFTSIILFVIFYFIYRIVKQRDELRLFTKEQESLLSLFDKGDSVLFKWNNDDNWSVSFVSKSVERLLGYTKYEFLSNRVNYSSCIHKDDIARVTAEVEEISKNNEVFFQHEPYRVITKSDEIKWVLDYTVVSRDDEGNIIDFLGYISDITQSKKINEELEKTKNEALKANKAKSEFLANMSHEIRTPLNGIIGLTDLVLETKLTDIQKDFLTKAKLSSSALLSVINDILDYSKIEAGKIDIQNQPFELKELFENISNLFEYQMNQKNIDLIYKFDKNIPAILVGDSLRIIQIINNLVGNAIKFTTTGYIMIEVKQTTDRDKNKVKLEFCVEDSGIGISSQNVAKLFHPFEQGDNSNTRKYGGTGLGLVISKQLTNLMGGDIWCTSELGVGSRFCFTLSVGYKEKEQNTHPYDKQDKIEMKQKESVFHTNGKVLLVEDNEINQVVASEILKNFGFEVVIVENGLEAVKSMKNNSFDIVFMDLQMPLMDGFEATSKIREFDMTTPIIALSAAVMEKDKELTKKVGMDEHLSKPIDKNKLQEILAKYFSQDIDFSKTIHQKQNNSLPNLRGINLNRLVEYLDMDINTVFSMLNNYKNTYSHFDEDIQKLHRESDEFKKYIHKLKGVSGNLEVNNVFDLTKQIEQTIELEKANILIEKLEKELKIVVVSIEENITPLVQNNINILSKIEIVRHIDTIIFDIVNYNFIKPSRIEEICNHFKNKIDNSIIKLINEKFQSNQYEELKDILEDIKGNSSE